MSCDREAKSLTLVKASEEMVGNGLSRWEPYWLCEVLHRAQHLAGQVEHADPQAQIISFTAFDKGGAAIPLMQALYDATVSRELKQ
jgi:hypothetical protein